MRSASCVLVLAVLSLGAGRAIAGTGDLLISYEAALRTLPAQQGWTCDCHCLLAGCPYVRSPDLPVGECRFQGETANTCRLGEGCGPAGPPAGRVEHFNAPGEPVPSGSCSYTEWLTFDDGEDYLDVPYPVSLPHTNLTFGPGDPLTTWGPHAHPAFGAPRFIRAPAGYPPLRIVTGSGIPLPSVLPASSSNMRNRGRISVKKVYSVSPGTTAVTLVAKVACGNRSPVFEVLQLSGFGRRFCFGVDGQDGSPALGRFKYGTNAADTNGLFGTRTVGVALARPQVRGPHDGEFFTVRIILHSNGAVEAWLNDDPATLWGTTAGTASGSQVQITPDEQSSTTWVDYVRLFEGAVLAPTCGDPVFDTNRDGRVDGWDRLNGFDGFLDCVTGPAAPASALQGFPERCACHDLNHDGSVDMIDFAAFQRCLTIAGEPLDARCDD